MNGLEPGEYARLMIVRAAKLRWIAAKWSYMGGEKHISDAMNVAAERLLSDSVRVLRIAKRNQVLGVFLGWLTAGVLLYIFAGVSPVEVFMKLFSGVLK